MKKITNKGKGVSINEVLYTNFKTNIKINVSPDNKNEKKPNKPKKPNIWHTMQGCGVENIKKLVLLNKFLFF